MDTAFKKHVVKTFINHKTDTFKSLRADQERKLELAGQDNIESKQIESRNDAAVRELDFLNRNIDLLTKEVELLEKVPVNDNSEKVGFGSLVKTDKATFLVAVAQEKLNVEGEEVLGISMASPLFKKIEGKKKGETAEVSGMNHKLEEVV
jgi:transcription elongation GreA/GreB family factor